MQCPICNRQIKRKNVLKIHINSAHNDLDIVQREVIFIKTCINVSDLDIENIKNEYLDGSTRDEIRAKYNFDFHNYFKLLRINRTNSESKKTKKYKEKYTKTIQEKYGVSNISEAESVKAKKKETFLKNYGYENNFCNKEIHSKAEKNIDRFKAWETNKKVLIERYGVDNMSQIPSVRIKNSTSAKHRNSLLSYEDKLENTEKARAAINYVSSLELRIQNILNLFNIEYKANIFLYGYNYDFMFKHKTILEIQGDYWHANPELYKKDDLIIGEKTAEYFWDKDKKKKNVLTKNGYKVLYLWESEINKMSDEQIINYLTENLIL